MSLNITKLEFLRKSFVLKQDELSQKLGISDTTYRNLLKTGDFRTSQLELMSKIFDIPIGYLFDEVDEEGNKTSGDKLKEPRSSYSKKAEISELKERISELKNALSDKEKIIDLLQAK